MDPNLLINGLGQPAKVAPLAGQPTLGGIGEVLKALVPEYITDALTPKVPLGPLPEYGKVPQVQSSLSQVAPFLAMEAASMLPAAGVKGAMAIGAGLGKSLAKPKGSIMDLGVGLYKEGINAPIASNVKAAAPVDDIEAAIEAVLKQVKPSTLATKSQPVDQTDATIDAIAKALGYEPPKKSLGVAPGGAELDVPPEAALAIAGYKKLPTKIAINDADSAKVMGAEKEFVANAQQSQGHGLYGLLPSEIDKLDELYEHGSMDDYDKLWNKLKAETTGAPGTANPFEKVAQGGDMQTLMDDLHIEAPNYGQLTAKQSLDRGKANIVENPKTPEQVEADRIAGGYTTPSYMGSQAWGQYGKSERHIDNIDIDPAAGNFDGFFSAKKPELANMYAGLYPEGSGVENHLESLGSPSVQPMWLNTSKYLDYDAAGKRWSQVNNQAIRSAHEQGKAGVIMRNVWDEPASTRHLGSPQDLYITIDPSTARGQNAQFDPKKFHLNDLLAGLAGGGVLGSTLLGGSNSAEAAPSQFPSPPLPPVAPPAAQSPTIPSGTNVGPRTSHLPDFLNELIRALGAQGRPTQ